MQAFLLAGDCFSADKERQQFNNLKIMKQYAWLAGAMIMAGSSLWAADSENPFVGRWALTIPGGGAGWLGITEEKGYFDGGILWGGGSVVPVSAVMFSDDGDQVYVTRTREVKRKDATGKVIRTHQFSEVLIGRVEGDEIKFMSLNPRDNGKGFARDEFSGKRIPPLPAKPDLSQIKYGDEITLFNGQNLDGWKLTERNQVCGWFVADGVLNNDPKQEDGKPHKSYGNLRTEKEFEDFTLSLDTKLSKNGNSGIYLRGIYEVQVADTFGHGLDSHNMGGIYSRITPTASVEKPAGEWQHFDITLCNRHVTVVLNGRKIIDNQPLLGCTGGALWSDESRPGPLYLQGDHTGIQYRNITLKPIVK
jgi:hypothetical protein